MAKHKIVLSVGDNPKAKSSRKLTTQNIANGSDEAEGNSDIQDTLSQLQSCSKPRDDIDEGSDYVNRSNVKCLREDVDTLAKTVATLKETVQRQQNIINRLLPLLGYEANERVDTVVQESNEKNAVSSQNPPNAPSNRTYANITASSAVLDTNLMKPTLTKPVRQAVLTAIHTEMLSKQSRERNIIITGLHRSNTVSDKDLVCKMMFEELGLDTRETGVTLCKRLGKSPFTDDGRPQPLRVILPTATVARDILSSAKYLRQSADEYVRSNVYINADLTRAEADAAYHGRCARRQARQRKSTMRTSESTASASGEQRSVTTRSQHRPQQVSTCADMQINTQIPDCVSQNTQQNIQQLTTSTPHQAIVTADVHCPFNIHAAPFAPVPSSVQVRSQETIVSEDIVIENYVGGRSE